jgi:hypothetical protein
VLEMMEEHGRDQARERVHFMRDFYLAQDAHGEQKLAPGSPPPPDTSKSPRYLLTEFHEHYRKLEKVAFPEPTAEEKAAIERQKIKDFFRLRMGFNEEAAENRREREQYKQEREERRAHRGKDA